MTFTSITRCRSIAILAVFCLGATGAVWAENALFIGNSYTYGGSDPNVSKNGGVPKLVELMAAAKGKTLSTRMLAPGGQDWAFHLKQPETDQDLRLKSWDWVVLQDYSTKPTHLGNPDGFVQSGETFYHQIRATAPAAKVLLYETWARAQGNAFYTGVSSTNSFTDAAQMNAELQKNYTALQRRLEALDPGEQVRLAPVGRAFARCLEKYPELNLHAEDKHHANAQGSYLAALVIYATMFGDSPVGAPREFFGVTLPPDTARKFQQIAAEVVAP